MDIFIESVLAGLAFGAVAFVLFLIVALICYEITREQRNQIYQNEYEIEKLKRKLKKLSKEVSEFPKDRI